jgi:HD-GYP domain-containing protein (c-di-GMP phosphodiesterase class II)
MTTDRPYRKAMDFETAFEELRKYSGVQFDGYIVNVFIKIFKNKEFEQ